MTETSIPDSSYIKLCVGGIEHHTTAQTLRSHGPNYFTALLSGKFGSDLCRTPDGAIFVDRDGSQFKWILQYLRTGRLVFLQPPTESELLVILIEAEFFAIAPLIETLSAKCAEMSQKAGRPALPLHHLTASTTTNQHLPVDGTATSPDTQSRDDAPACSVRYDGYYYGMSKQEAIVFSPDGTLVWSKGDQAVNNVRVMHDLGLTASTPLPPVWHSENCRNRFARFMEDAIGRGNFDQHRSALLIRRSSVGETISTISTTNGNLLILNAFFIQYEFHPWSKNAEASPTVVLGAPVAAISTNHTAERTDAHGDALGAGGLR